MSIESTIFEEDIKKDIAMNTMDKSIEPIEEGLHLELGDIIEMVAPENHELHQNTFFITYLDAYQIKMKNVASLHIHNLNIEAGTLMDETIREIHLLSRSEEKGYARQNGLLPNTWITVYITGQFPTILHGKITELEADQIEIITMPENEVIYLDFAYKGIPQDIPIDKIVIRPAPEGIEDVTKRVAEEGDTYLTEPASTDKEGEEGKTASIEYTDEGESIIQVPEGIQPDENIREGLHNKYIRASDIVLFGETEEFQQVVEIPENKKHYGIEVQTSDLMHELISTVPSYQRTGSVLENIHHLISRFKQLRQLFSVYDEYGEIESAKIVGANYKPLVEHLRDWNTRLRWITPVVSLRKKIYNTEIYEGDIPDIAVTNLLDELTAQETKMAEYLEKKNIGDAVKYTETYQAIGKMATPYLPPVLNNDCLANKETQVELDAIIHNLEDFYGSVWSEADGITRNRFVIQRYNLAMTKLEKKEDDSTRRKVYFRKPISRNDAFCLKSLITLPEPVVRYSQVDLPSTTIGTRASLTQNPLYLFRLLKKNTEIETETVTDIDKEIHYEDTRGRREGDDVKLATSFLKAIKEYELDEEVLAQEGEEAYEKFLNVVIPTTRVLIQMIRKYITNRLSVVEVVQALQPFAIYTKDISYRQHDEIRYFIKERIRQFVKEYAEKKDQMNLLLNMKYGVRSVLPIIKSLLTDSTEPFFAKNYRIPLSGTDAIANSEWIHQIYHTDFAVLFTKLMHLDAIHLTTPEGLLDALKTSPEIDDLTDLEKIKPGDCARRFLTKRYRSLKDLQKDNMVEEVYYDKEFDKTPYSILERYANEKKKMEPEFFKEYLAENLIQKHDCPQNQSMELAETILQGKKLVKAGEYAILDKQSEKPGEKQSEKPDDSPTSIEYYRRRNNYWVHDTEVSEESFIDNNTLFCNINKTCLKNPKVNTCDTITDAKERMKEIARKGLRDEYTARLNEGQQDMREALTNSIETATEHIIKSHRLSEVERLRANLKQYELGKYAVKDFETITSPYQSVRDLIFAQTDFAKRQTDIYDFVQHFCREAVPEKEVEHWLYCKETNVKLMPLSLYKLATAFIENRYMDGLNTVCRIYGVLSDDGDSIVDKHSGYVLRKIEYSEEEGYDEAGFKVSTHDVLEKDTMTADFIADLTTTTKRVFENQRAEIIYGIIRFLSNKIGVPTEEIEKYATPICTELSEKLLLTEEKYNTLMEKAKKDGKVVPPPYSVYYQQKLIFIATAVVFVTIQTAIPSFKANKTVPGCVKSLTGYPAAGIEDLTGIRYMACILHNSRSSISPWDSIQQLNKTRLERGIKEVIEKNIMVRDDIVKRYASKAEYMELFPEIRIPNEHSLEQWRLFTPPLVPFHILNRLHPVAPHLKSEMIENMRRGNRAQHENIMVYKSKARAHAYGIIEAINAIVAEKGLFLKTSAKIPFLENACCDEAGVNPIRYFIEQEDDSKTIEKQIATVRSIETVMEDVRALSRAFILNHSINTRLAVAQISTATFDINIYSAFIHYCHLNTNVPIPPDLAPIMSEKPANYPSSTSIEEKMEFFRRNGRNYTDTDLKALMRIVNLRNKVQLYKPTPLLQIPALKAFLEHLERVATREDSSPVIEIPLISKLEKLVDAFHPYEMYIEPTAPLIALKKYLTVSNKQMLNSIIDFMEEFGQEFSNREMEKIQSHLENITKWKLDSAAAEGEGINIHQITTYIKNTIYQMIKEWPSILLHNIEFQNIPRHWGLSALHKDDIEHCLKQYYNELKPFYSDKIVSLLLKEMQTKVDLYTFVKMIPTFVPISKAGNTHYSFLDKEGLFALYQYVYYSVFYEYIRAANDNTLLYTDINEKRQIQRNKNVEMADESLVEAVETEETESFLPAEYLEAAEVEIEVGNQADLKTRVSKLLATFIRIQIKEKEMTDFSYEDIFAKVRKSRDQEKKLITDFFKRMETDERRMENMKKTLKLGRWNVGMQKGLFDYDADTYARERNDILAVGEDIFSNTTMAEEQVVRVVEDLDADYQAAMNEEDGDGQYGLGDLGEDYNDNIEQDEREDEW